MEFLDSEAVCEDVNDSIEYVVNELCSCTGACNCTDFIDDTVCDDISKTPPRTPWETTCFLDNQDEESCKRLREVTNSVEKLQVTRSPLSKKPRNINEDLLNCDYEVPIETQDLLATALVNSEILFESESLLDQDLNVEATEAYLKKSFMSFSVFRQSEGFLQEKKGPRWGDLAKPMKSDKTMQKHWIVFFKIPLNGKKTGPTRNLVTVETLLEKDSEGIRSKSNSTFACFLLEYRVKSRSKSGLVKLLAQANITSALIGVPFLKKPLVRDYVREYMTVLDEDVNRDIQLLHLNQDGKSVTKFNPEEMILYCEEHEPKSVEILISNYRTEAQGGNDNAQAWVELCSAYNNAQTCFKMWKATVKGKQMQLSLTDYIAERSDMYSNGNAINMRKLLVYQGINELVFTNTVRKWLQGKPKQNILCFVGPGSSGKSMLAEAMNVYLDGCVLAVNEHNTFWKQGVIGKRFSLIDDVTLPQWHYLDVSERRTLDGGLIAINKKFSDAVETRMPPTLITTNYYLPDQGDQFSFLINRLTWIKFQRSLPTTSEGLSRILVTAKDVAAWILTNKDSLDLD
ncbi:MAG: E1 protein [Melanogrammus aeglefinus-associated papillomavirus 1]|nr:MAG: E1 protein [Melanogrammus aeglefinus-associated papillomavirus 1]